MQPTFNRVKFTNGPTEQDILLDHGGQRRGYLTFSIDGVELPFSITRSDTKDFVDYQIEGVVLPVSNHPLCGVKFKTTYNPAIQSGEADFEIICTWCKRKECQPPGSCLIPNCSTPNCNKKAPWIVPDVGDGIFLCEECYAKQGGKGGTSLI